MANEIMENGKNGIFMPYDQYGRLCYALAHAKTTMYDETHTVYEIINILASGGDPGSTQVISVNGKSGEVTLTVEDMIANIISNDNINPTKWEDVNRLENSESYKSIFTKLSTMFKNVRYLWKLMGKTDISKIGNGTITGALSTINTNVSNTRTDLATIETNVNNIQNEWDSVCRLSDELDKEWKVISGTSLNVALGFGNGRFVGYSSNSFYYSDDGLTWNKGTAIVSGITIKSIAYGKGMYVAISNTSTIYYSSDGIRWYTAGGNLQCLLTDVAFGNDVFVAVGSDGGDDGTVNGEMRYSFDGVIWKKTIARNSYDIGGFNSVAFNGTSFVAISSDGNYNAYTTTGEIYTEIDGRISLYSIEYGNGVFVAKDYEGQMPYGNLYYSYTGNIWTKANTPNTYAFIDADICFGNGIFIVNTDDGVYLKSKDGINWKEVEYKTVYPVFGACITYGNGKFISNGKFKSKRDDSNGKLIYLEFMREGEKYTPEEISEAISKALAL